MDIKRRQTVSRSDAARDFAGLACQPLSQPLHGSHQTKDKTDKTDKTLPIGIITPAAPG
jgi:hypothetical protein